MKKTVASLEKDKADREAVEKFNVRMGQATDAYDFDVEQTEVIASEIKSIKSDEEFTQWEAKAKKLFKPFKKGAKKDDKKADDAKDDKGDDNDADADGKKKDAKASEAKASVVDNAIDNAKKDGAVANSATAQAPTLMEKYKEAFAMENFIVNKR
jgi:hypothetical protein